jgi:spore coat polysaccharide biosynthesis protein SpsF (cytidylyltransferase family)
VDLLQSVLTRTWGIEAVKPVRIKTDHPFHAPNLLDDQIRQVALACPGERGYSGA